MREVKEVELLNVNKLVAHFENWFNEDTITIEDLNDLRELYAKRGDTMGLFVSASGPVGCILDQMIPRKLEVNVDVGIPGICYGEFNDEKDFYSLCAAYVMKIPYVKSRASGACDYILFLADADDEQIEYRNLEPIIKTEKQAIEYEELANRLVYGPAVPLVGPDVPKPISDWLSKNQFEDHHLLLISSTVIPFRFMAGVVKYWRERSSHDAS